MLGGVYFVKRICPAMNDNFLSVYFVVVVANRFLFFAELRSATFCRPFELDSFLLLPRFVTRVVDRVYVCRTRLLVPLNA